MDPLKELLAKRADTIAAQHRILDKADADGKRDLNSEERAEYERLDTETDALNDKIDAKQFRLNADAKRAKNDLMLAEPMLRQTPAVSPTPRGGDGAALEFDFGRAGKVKLRPDSPHYGRAARAYDEGFETYLRSGQTRGLESLTMTVGTDPQGGYNVPIAFLSMVIKFLDNEVFMRRLGTVLPPTDAKSVGVLSYDTDPSDADWTAEITASDISEDDATRWGKREMTPHLLTKLLTASRQLVRAYPELASWLAQRLAYVFGVTEEKAYLTGTGSQQPLGIFTSSTSGITTTQDITASGTTTFTADDLINTLYDLKDPYASRATWLGTREFRKRCRKLKDGVGNYLLVEGERNNQGTLTMLLERPLVVSEYAPQTYTTGLYVAAVGDLSFYWIQDSLNMEIQYLLELLSLRNKVGWIARKSTDGMPVLAEAFRRLKLA